MTLVTGTVQDLGYDSLEGVLYARPARFRSDGQVIFAPERTPYNVVAGVVSVELAPGPAVLELRVGSHARDLFDVVIPDQDEISLADLLDTVFPWEPAQVSQFVAEREAAQQAKDDAVLAAGDAKQAKTDAVGAATQAGQDRTAVAQDRQHVDGQVDAIDAAFTESIPPYLQKDSPGGLNATYVPQTELPNLATKAELDAKKGGTPATAGVELLAGKLAFGGAGRHHIGVVADSTFNDHREAPWVWWMQYGELFPPSVRRVYNYWNNTTGVWNRNVNAEGTGTPASDGVVLTDSFTRTVADVVGTSPDTGPVWQGNPGVWSADGTSASAGAGGDLNVNAGARDITLTVELKIATATTLDQTHRYYIGATSAPVADGVWALVSANSTGVLSLRLYTTFAGTSTAVGTAISGGTIGVPSGAADPVTLTVELSINIQNISATFTGPSGSQTLTGTITEAQYAGLGTWVGIKSLNAASPGLKIDSVGVAVPPTPASGDSIEMWNGSWAGAKISSFTPAVRAQRFGDKHIDVLILSMGHNNSTQTPEAFVAEIEAWVNEWMVEHPETVSVMWVSQNPQFPPAAGGEAHRARQAAMRVAARKNSWDYIPAFEAFAALPDGGQSMVNPDGIHPTIPPSGQYTGEFGSVVTAREIHRAVTDRL